MEVTALEAVVASAVAAAADVVMAVVGAWHVPGAPIMPGGVTQTSPAAQRTWYMGATVSWHSSPAPARPLVVGASVIVVVKVASVVFVVVVVVVVASVMVVVGTCAGAVAPVHLSGHTPLLDSAGTQTQHGMHVCWMEQNSAPGPALWSSGQL